MPVSPKEKYWAAVEYTFPDFLPLQGDLWTRFSYTWQGKIWDSLDRDRGQRSPRFLTRRLDTEVDGTFQVGFTSDNGWETALIVRNLFDDAGVTWLSSTRLRRALRRSALALHARRCSGRATISLSFTKKW